MSRRLAQEEAKLTAVLAKRGDSEKQLKVTCPAFACSCWYGTNLSKNHEHYCVSLCFPLVVPSRLVCAGAANVLTAGAGGKAR